jgi:hypothetical protein
MEADKEALMKILRKIPMFGFMLAIYDLLLLTGKDPILGNILVRIKMMSGAEWILTVGDLFVVLGLVFLFVEVFKSTRTNEAAIFDHILSTLIFIVFVVEFIVLKGAGTTVFFILTLMSLFDVVAGFTITIKTARRDFTMDRESSFIPPSNS